MKKISYLISFLFLGLIAHGQDLEEYIEEARKNYQIPGMAVGVIQDGEVILEKGFGKLNNDKKTAVTENSSFAIASLSKAFTAAGVAKLVEEGELAWDDKVTDILPWFRVHDEHVTDLMTLEDLLCHRIGLKTFDGDLLWYGTDYSSNEILRRIRHLPLSQDFRDDYGYQNIMYIAAGAVIEEVTGLSWEDFVRKHFIKPLDMDRTRTGFEALKKNQEVAAPHLEGKPIEGRSYANAAPAAGLNSNVNDLLQWLKMLMNEGIYEKDSILPASVVEDVFSPRTVLQPNSIERRAGSNFKFYGLGWSLTDYHNVKVAFHGGGLPGYISKIAVVPGEDVGLVVLSNDMSSLPTALMYEILDRLLADEENDRANQFLKYEKMRDQRKASRREDRDKKRDEHTSSSLPVSSYAGTYEDDMYGIASIDQQNGDLYIDLKPTGFFQSKLEHWHHDVYKIKWEDPFLPRGFVYFNLNADGEVTGFRIDMPNPDFHFDNLKFERSTE